MRDYFDLLNCNEIDKLLIEALVHLVLIDFHLFLFPNLVLNTAVNIEWTDSKSKSNIIISSEKTLSNEAYKLNIDIYVNK